MDPILKTIIGCIIEVMIVDSFTVTGLAIQKIAVMKIIENNRNRFQKSSLSAQQPKNTSGFIVDSSADWGFRGVDITPILSEVCSEVMTVQDSESCDSETENDTPVPDIIELLSSPMWFTGLAVFIFGNMIELVALSLTTQTNIALLSNFALIWNVFLSVKIFDEEFHLFPIYLSWSSRVFHRWDASHCAILLVGSMLAVFSCPPAIDNTVDPKDLFRYWTEAPYVYWCGFMIFSMITASVILFFNWHNLNTGNLNAALLAGLCGFMSAFCVTLSKIVTTLVSYSLKGDNQFKHPEVVFLFCLWITVLPVQVFLLSVGLGSFEQGLVVPIFEVVGTLCSVISGMLFYKVFDLFSTTMWIGFSIGVSLMCWGVWLVAHREVHTQQELSHNLYANLGHVDEMLRITAFSSNAKENNYVSYVQRQETFAEDCEESVEDRAEQQYRTTTTTCRPSRNIFSKNDDGDSTYEYTAWNLSSVGSLHNKTTS